MMRSHFRGSDTLVAGRMITSLVLILFLEIPVMATAGDGDEMMMMNPIVELSSREELVNMAGYGEEKLSTVTISGRVLCHACVYDHIDSDTHHHAHQPNPVPGASIAVFCGNCGKSRKSWARGITDEYGDFLIDLPSHLHAIPNLEKVCLLKVLHLPKNSDCRPAFTGKHKGIKLLSIEDGSRAYTASTINLTTKPSKACKNMPRNRKEMIHVH